jgi:hypothetical protein
MCALIPVCHTYRRTVTHTAALMREPHDHARHHIHIFSVSWVKNQVYVIYQICGAGILDLWALVYLWTMQKFSDLRDYLDNSIGRS